MRLKKKAMTKKQTSKKKVNLKLKPNEAYIVADSGKLLSIAEVYESLARNETDRQLKASYIDLSTFIRESVRETYFDPDLGSDYEDWD